MAKEVESVKSPTTDQRTFLIVITARQQSFFNYIPMFVGQNISCCWWLNNWQSLSCLLVRCTCFMVCSTIRWWSCQFFSGYPRVNDQFDVENPPFLDEVLAGLAAHGIAHGGVDTFLGSPDAHGLHIAGIHAISLRSTICPTVSDWEITITPEASIAIDDHG